LSRVEPEGNSSTEQACAVISSWIRQQSRGRRRDWHRLLAEMHALLGQLCAQHIIASDAKARAIIAEMARSEDMEEIAFHVDQLALRVQQLQAAQSGRNLGGVVLSPVSSAARPPIAQNTAIVDDDQRSRTFLRL
jgi:hypothetical protein